MRNNLENIRVDAPVYRMVTYNILKELPDDLLATVNEVKQIAVVGSDSYFLHYSMFPSIVSDPNPDKILETARENMIKYSESKSYRKIKPVTTLDHDLSMVYAIKLTEAIAKEIKKKLEEQGNQPKLPGTRKEAIEAIINAMASGTNQPNQGQGGSGSVQFNLPQDVIAKAVANARKEAEKATEVAKEIKDIIGNKRKGRGGGEGGYNAGDQPGDFKKLLDLTNKVLSVEWGTKIVSTAKKIDDLTFYVKLRKARDRFGDELGGYRVTRKVEEAIARELALPDDLFFAKLVSGSLIAKEKLRVSEGAYYVLIDKSGSMHGEKTIWARSVALALYKIAAKKKREYFLRFFDKRTSKLLVDPTEVVEAILTIRSDGGTSIAGALYTATKDLLRNKELRGKTNTIVIITDGEDKVPESVLAELKVVNARLVAVMIQGTNATLKSLAEATGGQYLRAELTEEGALRVVEASE